MLNLTNLGSLLPAGLLLALYQFLAALPWLWALDPRAFKKSLKSPQALGTAVGTIAIAGVIIAAILGFKRDPDTLAFYGRFYAAILHIQLLIDFLIIAPQLVLLVWPRGGAVTLAAYREGMRQPTFWVVALAAMILIIVSMVIPYFTFGDEYKMMKQLGFDTIMLASGLFGVLAASISIYEEIEGRTAITLLSKPISRRQFLIGKFLGIAMAAMALTLVLGWILNWALYIKPSFDKLEEVRDTMPLEVQDVIGKTITSLVPGNEGASVASGIAAWFGETIAHHTGLLLGFGQVMVLIAIASALATRLPYVVNIVLCLVIFLLGNLSPVLVQVTSQAASDPNAASGLSLVSFVAQLIDALLPALEFFNMGPAIIRDNPLQMGDFTIYVLTVFGYSIIYVSIAMLVGLILFEDRDLA
ncbi:ABC transporter permease [Tuwongella immobilis]|uniref:ABC transporter permease n=1 Tax=Tuwongella immobilis TaxID=692036 RepID=A0A6C2YN92_9BACT|nr:ABC transporter permease [Tuwongella immobilis]VIP02679.1 ABC-type transport system involved in multi-copper enzyme maturation, permease component OS=Singulisphaera acidiphila (strain ATCC BAA-1392 / DSM 18658 / VKM B-2454 / MOB10) GN=Sinac_6109 PE=4 SV=1: ABC2_membrane_2 [Tuwongella immobilis]VTS02126.1 ABC-type transport system involved in multi-copper enzyme maturation, permease component OS=Singulisphaera acidiphila (strain ATCC BAA-1392 / DSM 18658 / VKM B-2454 / MOB10) GN=Sinac_6109 PE=4